MDTPESIRASLIQGEWVLSIDLSDAYLHIPIHPNSRKYLRFCHKSQVFQFTSLPFGLATAAQVFTMIVKEVKLMALTRGIRLHQYLDDWLIRAQSQEEAQVNTQTVVNLTWSLGWIINQEKSKLKPGQVFSFVGYEYFLDSALVKPTKERWIKLQDLILRLKSKHVLTARCLMSLIGLLASMGHRCSEHKLVGSHCLCLLSHGSPSQGDPKNQAMQLSDHCNSPRLARDALVLGPSAALNRYPTPVTSVKNSSQTVPQLCVSQQSTTSQPSCLVSKTGQGWTRTRQLQEQGFSVEVAENCCPSEVINKDHLQVKVGPI